MTSENEFPTLEPEPNDDATDVQVLSQLVSALKPLSQEARTRLFRTLAAFFEIPLRETTNAYVPQTTLSVSGAPGPSFSEDRSISPKQFVFEKRPTTDVERVTCLAYYLTHYRSTPHFKTLDISKLNTEAAQIKFSNPAVAVDNATKAGFLVQASKGQKQVSSIGEMYVQALPDRVAARAAVEHARRRRNRAKKSSAKSVTDSD
jgi:hypothetical protein